MAAANIREEWQVDDFVEVFVQADKVSAWTAMRSGL
jgi:hypothetical protein